MPHLAICNTQRQGYCIWYKREEHKLIVKLAADCVV
jgi:hypothetical protein